MFTKQTFVITCLFVSLCDSLSVDDFPRCSLKDKECQRNLYQNVIKDTGKMGIPELGIPAVDPIVLKNVSVSVFNLLNITMVDGVATGTKDCIINKFEIDLDRGISTKQVTCDITVEGQYSLSGNSTILKPLLGNNGIHGEGKGKVKLEKVVVNWKLPFYFEKKEDGEIYLKCLCNEMEYNYDVKGKTTFEADNIYVGKENINENVVNYLNQNWKFVMRTFGKSFMDKAMKLYFDFAQKFFEGVPARYYIFEDFTAYVK